MHCDIKTNIGQFVNSGSIALYLIYYLYHFDCFEYFSIYGANYHFVFSVPGQYGGGSVQADDLRRLLKQS